MALPDNITTVWVRGQISGARGRVTFQPSPSALVDPSERLTISTSAPYVAVLALDGSFAVELPATDDPDVQPTGWTYQVSDPIRPGFSIVVPAATPLLNSPGDDLDGERVLDLANAAPLPGANAGTVQVITPPPASAEDIAAAVDDYLTDNPPGTDPVLAGRVDELDMEQDAHHVRLDALEAANDDQETRIGVLEASPPTGLAAFEHVQSVAQSVWTVQHNLGRYPVAWSLFDQAGRECGQYVVQHLDPDTSRVSMDLPTAGLLRLV